MIQSPRIDNENQGLSLIYICTYDSPRESDFFFRNHRARTDREEGSREMEIFDVCFEGWLVILDREEAVRFFFRPGIGQFLVGYAGHREQFHTGMAHYDLALHQLLTLTLPRS